MVGVVFLIVDAWRDELELGRGRLGREEPALGRGVAAGLHQKILAVAGLADAEVEALVLLFVDDDILAGGRAQRVAEEMVVALGDLILGGVEEGLRVGGPGDRADAQSGIGQVCAGLRSRMCSVYWRKPVLSVE